MTRKARDREGYAAGQQPGLTMGTAPWFHDRDVAAVATDTYPFEVWPCEDDTMLLPVHLLFLRDMGLKSKLVLPLPNVTVWDAAGKRLYQTSATLPSDQP